MPRLPPLARCSHSAPPLWRRRLCAFVEAVRYNGLAGEGGLSAMLQPEVVELWFAAELSPVVSALDAINWVLVLLGMLVAAHWLRKRGVDAVRASAVVCLIVYVLGVHWFAQYGTWAIPFLALAGHLGYALTLSAVYSLYPWAAGAWLALPLSSEPPTAIWQVTPWILMGLWLMAIRRVGRARTAYQPSIS